MMHVMKHKTISLAAAAGLALGSACAAHAEIVALRHSYGGRSATALSALVGRAARVPAVRGLP